MRSLVVELTQRTGGAAAALIVLLGAGACSSGTAAPALPVARNAILISIDTLRADHLGCYGYPRDTSPKLDAFRQEAVLFEQAYSQAPATLLSHAALLTSLLPQHHGASRDDQTPLPEGVLTLAESLQAAGLRTASFNEGGQIRPIFGLTQGFEVYESRDPPHSFAAIVEQAKGWMDEHADERFFLFLHTYEVHHPYTPRPDLLELFDDGYAGPLPDHISIELLREINDGKRDISEADLRHIMSAYDAEIRSMDEALGELMAYLRQAGLYDDTVIVFTSDHGEEFGEHGLVGWHSHTLFDELLRVPLAIKLAGSHLAGETVTSQVRLIDVAPTLSAALGLPIPAEFFGKSLAGVLDGHRDGERPAVAMLNTHQGQPGPGSIRTERWKWIDRELYDLAADPGEHVNVAGENRRTARRLERELRKILASRERARSDEVELDTETVDRLKALGYVQ